MQSTKQQSKEPTTPKQNGQSADHYDKIIDDIAQNYKKQIDKLHSEISKLKSALLENELKQENYKTKCNELEQKYTELVKAKVQLIWFL